MQLPWLQTALKIYGMVIPPFFFSALARLPMRTSVHSSLSFAVCALQEMDTDELECILANLIFQKKIRGYIMRKKCVVLGKKDPFPNM